MTLDGALMGSVGDANVVDHKVVGAIASHTWGEYAHSSKEVNAGHALQTLLVELEVSELACFGCRVVIDYVRPGDVMLMVYYYVHTRRMDAWRCLRRARAFWCAPTRVATPSQDSSKLRY